MVSEPRNHSCRRAVAGLILCGRDDASESSAGLRGEFFEDVRGVSAAVADEVGHDDDVLCGGGLEGPREGGVEHGAVGDEIDNFARLGVGRGQERDGGLEGGKGLGPAAGIGAQEVRGGAGLGVLAPATRVMPGMTVGRGSPMRTTAKSCWA